MKILSVSKIVRNAALCAGVLLASASFMQAREVSVYLTSKRFGDKTGFVADSQTRTINPATQYSYELKGKVRGQSGKPLEKIVPKGTDIATFVNLVSPGGSSFLKGTFANPGGTLPVTLMNKQFKGTKKVKFPGMKKSVKVKFDFTVVGSINADGIVVMEVKNVNITTDPKIVLGDIIFTKGSILTVNDAP